MRLPASLVRLRSALADCLARACVLCEPLNLRLMRFVYEVRARSLLRGPVAPGVQFVGPIIREGTGAVRIGPGTRIGRRVFFETYGDAVIDIGSHVTINDGCVLVAYAGISVGDHTMIGEYASIRDANHGTSRNAFVHDQPHIAGRIEIGRDVWIGRGCAVLKNVTLGEGSIIAANSVVNRNVDSYIIAGGVPARPLKDRV